MTKTKRKKVDWSLRELLIKIAILSITISIGLWCGWSDSYSSFYIAALIQAINNIYDASAFLQGYTLFVTLFQGANFFGGLLSAIISILHFTAKGKIVDRPIFLVFVTLALSIPVLHFGIEVYCMLREDRY